MSEFSFTKLFSSITKSTVWCEPHTTLRVWITLLADCDSIGRVHASVPGLASLARVTLLECERALATFQTPDPYSRTSDYEGRRIEVIDGGWRLLNYELYREKRNTDARKEQNRQAQRRHRAARQTSAEVLTDADNQQWSAQGRGQKTEVRKEQEQEQVRSRGSRLPKDWQPNAAEFKWAWAERPDLEIDKEFEKFRDYWHAKAGRDALKADWGKTWRNWIRNAHQGVSLATRATRESLTEQSARLNRQADLEEQRHERAVALLR